MVAFDLDSSSIFSVNRHHCLSKQNLFSSTLKFTFSISEAVAIFASRTLSKFATFSGFYRRIGIFSGLYPYSPENKFDHLLTF